MCQWEAPASLHRGWSQPRMMAGTGRFPPSCTCSQGGKNTEVMHVVLDGRKESTHHCHCCYIQGQTQPLYSPGRKERRDSRAFPIPGSVGTAVIPSREGEVRAYASEHVGEGKRAILTCLGDLKVFPDAACPIWGYICITVPPVDPSSDRKRYKSGFGPRGSFIHKA